MKHHNKQKLIIWSTQNTDWGFSSHLIPFPKKELSVFASNCERQSQKQTSSCEPKHKHFKDDDSNVLQLNPTSHIRYLVNTSLHCCFIIISLGFCWCHFFKCLQVPNRCKWKTRHYTWKHRNNCRSWMTFSSFRGKNKIK